MTTYTTVPVQHGTAVDVNLTCDGVNVREGEIKLRIGPSWAIVKIDDLLKGVIEAMPLWARVRQMLGRVHREPDPLPVTGPTALPLGKKG